MLPVSQIRGQKRKTAMKTEVRLSKLGKLKDFPLTKPYSDYFHHSPPATTELFSIYDALSTILF